MKHLIEDFFLLLIFSIAFAAFCCDKVCRKVERLRARLVLWRENICTKHNRPMWYSHGCLDCKDEWRHRERMRLEASAMKRSARIEAARKVLGLSQ